MISFFMAACLSVVSSGNTLDQTYADAYAKSIADQKPLMVVVASPACPACEVLKSTTITPMAQMGELSNVEVAVIDRDQQPELVQKLTRGVRAVPQIIVFSRDSRGGWKRDRLMGYQPKQPVRSLIRKAIGG